MSTDEGRRKILVIDDDTDFQEIASAILHSAGYGVAVASSGEEGLATAAAYQPDAVVLDLMLERPDAGFAVAYRLRQLPGAQDLPIILVTASARETGFRFDLDSAEERQWIKANVVLNKPISREDLVKHVSEALRQPV